jgi:hypothetical protein
VEKIDFDQMQKAMGIQQARWSFDPANECYAELNEEYKKNNQNIRFAQNIIGFTYFNKLPEKEQDKFAGAVLRGGFSYKLYYTNTQIRNKIMSEIKSAVNNRIFYKTEDSDDPYLGIPQTYDVTSVTCFHKPILIFGSLGPKTMVNFVIKHNMRPFAAHLPGSPSNLTEFDTIHGDLINNWIHDFAHQLTNKMCSVKNTIKKTKDICTEFDEIVRDDDFPGEDATPEDWLNNEKFQKCLDTEKPYIDDPDNKYFSTVAKYTAESFLDSGDIFKKYQRKNYLLGGKKTKRRNRKTRGKKQKRSRKHP